jgi:ABC-type cobalamin transport system permease subunit
MALFCGGMIFSAFHYMGTFGELFIWSSFLSRSIAGVFLGAVYLFRGLGITVYTHIFYDMVLVAIPVTSNG